MTHIFLYGDVGTSLFMRPSPVVSCRANTGLLRAMRQFVQGKPNSEFWKKACRLEVRTSDRLVDLFVASAKGSRHPEPKMAGSLGMMMVINTLQELILNTPDMKLWKGLLPQDDQTLKNELTRAFLSCLGAG